MISNCRDVQVLLKKFFHVAIRAIYEREYSSSSVTTSITAYNNTKMIESQELLLMCLLYTFIAPSAFQTKPFTKL